MDDGLDMPEAMSARLAALEELRDALVTGDPDASDAMRRLAGSLIGLGGGSSLESTASVIAELSGTIPVEIADALLGELRSLHALEPDRQSEILIVEDDLVTAENLADALADPNRTIRIAGTEAEARRMISDHPPALVVLDLVLPDADGRTILAQLRNQPVTAGIPILILTGKSRPRIEAECLALGADAVFEKPPARAALVAAVASQLQRGEESRRRSRRDPLTGLPNRAAIREAYDRSASFAKRSETALSVAILDLDRFKSVNDTYGHETGDEVLRRAASVLTRVLRKSDFLGRWGGEEFVLLFPESNPIEAATALEKGLAVLKCEEITARDGRSFGVTFSAGVASVSPEASLETAVEAADALLYMAKESGRARVIHAESKVSPTVKKILVAEDDDLTAEIILNEIAEDGHELVRAADGERALCILRDGGIALAVIDVQMPLVNGFDVLKEFRSLPGGAKVPVIMLTALGNEKAITRAFEAGADDYVVKPFSAVELKARIRRLLKRG